MSDQLKVYLLSLLFLFIALMLQSTLFEFLSIGGAKPDLSLIIIVFLALRKGKIVGQSLGFITGLIEDFLSLPLPVGFSALTKTIIGFLYGLFKGRMFIGPILMPAVIIFVATIIKFFLAAILALLFPQNGISFFSFRLLIEILYNCFLAPLLFAFFNLFKTFRLTEKEKY